MIYYKCYLISYLVYMTCITDNNKLLMVYSGIGAAALIGILSIVSAWMIWQQNKKIDELAQSNKSLKNAVDNSDVKSVMENLTKVLNEDEIKNLVSKIENFEGSLTDSAANKTEILNAIKGAKEAINQSTEESIQKVST